MTKPKNLRVGLLIRQQMAGSTSPILLAQEKGVLKPCKNSIPYIDEHGDTPKAPEQTTGKTRDGGGVTTGEVPQGYSLTKEINTSSYTGLSYPWGQCTWFVYNRGKEVGVSFG